MRQLAVLRAKSKIDSGIISNGLCCRVVSRIEPGDTTEFSHLLNAFHAKTSNRTSTAHTDYTIIIQHLELDYRE
jgi:hypothetical protein